MHVGRPPVQLGLPAQAISQRSVARAWVPRLHDALPLHATRQIEASQWMGWPSRHASWPVHAISQSGASQRIPVLQLDAPTQSIVHPASFTHSTPLEQLPSPHVTWHAPLVGQVTGFVQPTLQSITHVDPSHAPPASLQAGSQSSVAASSTSPASAGASASTSASIGPGDASGSRGSRSSIPSTSAHAPAARANAGVARARTSARGRIPMPTSTLLQPQRDLVE